MINIYEKHCRRIAKRMLKEVGCKVSEGKYENIIGEGRVYRVVVSSSFPSCRDGAVISFKTRQAFKQWYRQHK